MSLKKVELKFDDHTLMIDELGSIYVKEISEESPVLGIDMYYCTDEGRDVADSTNRSEIKDKPAIVVYDNVRDDPRIIIRYRKDGSVMIENL